ncbi:MAG TPA: outer membrane beta-barrel protein [Usitatibacter sp.]|nr:outer membrane beta-barrel protein [Usitatibacter sp.]
MRFSESGSSQPAAGISGKSFPIAALLAAGLVAATPAYALFDDHVEIFAAENITHDTNVLRLSKNLTPESVGATQLGDTVYSTHLGISGNLQWSQQLFTAEYTRYHSDYKYFNDLDFTGHTARAHWQWLWGQNKNGSLGYSESVGLSSFNNIQSREPDLVTARNAYFTGNWLVTPRWKATAGVIAVQARHSDPERGINNIDTESVELGGAYVTPLDNSAGLFVRYEHGRMPEPEVLQGFPLGFHYEYNQYGLGTNVVWNPAGHSKFEGKLELVRREYKQATDRNYTGPIIHALYTWSPTPKFKMLTAATRDVGPADDIQTSFVLVTGAYVRPVYQWTEKLLIQGNAEYNVWDYRGNPISGDFRHRVRTFGGRLDYHPTTKILLSAGVNREVRTSDLVNGDYAVTVGFIEGRVGF